MNFLILSLITLLFFSSYGKILIFSPCYNRPDLTALQYGTLKKFLVNDFDYVVFNDASEPEMAFKIQTTCRDMGVKCIKIPQEIHTKPYLPRPRTGLYKNYNIPNVRNANVVQWSLNLFGLYHNDILILLDGDIFLTKKLDVRKLLENYEVATFLRPCSEYPVHDCKLAHPSISTVKYMWIGLVFLDIPKLPNKKDLNFNCGIVENNIQVDAGGFTYYYLKNNPTVKIKNLNRVRTRELSIPDLKLVMENLDFSREAKQLAYKIKFIDPLRGIEFYMQDFFVHYFGATNYDHFNRQFIDSKNKVFTEFIDKIMKQNSECPLTAP